MATKEHTASRRAPAVPGRWRHVHPVQARGRETTERFARAAEELLRTRPFEEITIQDIVSRAERPIGSFYARFASKEALLPHLYQRYHDGLEPLFASRLAKVAWDSLDFEPTIERLVDFLIGQYVERRWLIRALAIFSRVRPEALPPDIVQRRRKVFDHTVAILLRHRDRIAHADPEAAIRFGVFLVSSVAREKLLFAEAPLSRVTPITRTALHRELVRALHGYLASGDPR
jgi:AcrR family transcriptional regulator